MSSQLAIAQILNGIQLGLMLFLIASGLTLIFGIMDTINLAHGSLYMFGAFLAATISARSGSFLIGVLGGMAATGLLAILLEIAVMRRLYTRDHLTQVLATFALILISNDVVRLSWGPQPILFNTPAQLRGPVQLPLLGISYPAYRLLLIGIGAVVAVILFVIVTKTRAGMWVRAGASDRQMASVMGVRIDGLFTAIFALGAALSALAGALTGPLLSVQIGMGEDVLILAFLVIVIGGIGSIRGALLASLLVGIVDTTGRVLIPMLVRQLELGNLGTSIGSTLASVLIYLLMALILTLKPEGLFPARR